MAPGKSEAAAAAKLAEEIATGMDAATMEKCRPPRSSGSRVDAEWGLRT